MRLLLRHLIPAAPMLLLAAAASALLGGCMTPDYHMPQGFSSTYHRALFASPPIEYRPLSALSSAAAGAAGVFFPADVEYQLVERVPETGPESPFAPLASTEQRRTRR